MASDWEQYEELVDDVLPLSMSHDMIPEKVLTRYVACQREMGEQAEDLEGAPQEDSVVQEVKVLQVSDVRVSKGSTEPDVSEEESEQQKETGSPEEKHSNLLPQYTTQEFRE